MDIEGNGHFNYVLDYLAGAKLDLKTNNPEPNRLEISATGSRSDVESVRSGLLGSRNSPKFPLKTPDRLEFVIFYNGSSTQGGKSCYEFEIYGNDNSRILVRLVPVN